MLTELINIIKMSHNNFCRAVIYYFKMKMIHFLCTQYLKMEDNAVANTVYIEYAADYCNVTLNKW